MSDDRLSHEKFLEELAAFDKVLRSPVEPAPPPVSPPDPGLDEPRDLVPSSRDTALRAPAARPSLSQQSRVTAARVGALSAGLLAGGLLGWWLALNPIVRTPPTAPAAGARSTTAPVASRSTRPATLPPAAPNVGAPVVASAPAIASREVASTIEAARKAAGAPPSDASPSIVASHDIASTMKASRRSAAAAPRERRVSSPLSSRSMRTIGKASSAPPTRTASPPSAPSATAGGAGIPSVTIAPAPAIAAPLPAAPLAVKPSMPPAAPPARAAAGALAAAIAADEAAIEMTLRQYEDAYERLDAKAALAVWPTVDQRALSRAFAGLASQDLVFRGCEVVVRAGAGTATASCRGTAEYVRKVGNPRPHVEPREWLFTLNKTQGEWRIETVDGRR